MENQEQLRQRYLEMGRELEATYSEMDFRNHCYWRIALDNVLGEKWDRVIDRPAYKNLSENELKEVLERLHIYLQDRDRLLRDNERSLSFRKKKT